jgi:hypothetical protein
MRLSLKALIIGGLIIFLSGAVSGGFVTSLRLAQAQEQHVAQVVQPTDMADIVPEEVPGSPLAGLPRYPGSTRVEYRRTVYGNLVVTEVEYVALADSAELREYFRRTFESHGWAVTDSGITAGEWSFVVVDGEREAVVEIELHGSPVNYEIKLTEPYKDATSMG